MDYKGGQKHFSKKRKKKKKGGGRIKRVGREGAQRVSYEARRKKEGKALLLYNQALKDIIYPFLGKKTTWSHDLIKMGHKLFQKNFVGVFASDKLPALGKNHNNSTVTNNNVNPTSKLYCICNIDRSNLPGSHWLALAYDVGSRKIYVYDSFGRPTHKIIPSVIEKYGSKNLKMANPDPEQALKDEDCGARSLAFLWVFDRVGKDFAKLI